MAVIRYLVDDVDSAVRFYTTHLGFTLERRWGPAFAIMARGDLRVWLSGPESSAARPMPNGRRPTPGGWNRLVIEVEDVRATVDALKKSGVRFRSEPLRGIGGTQVLLEDSAGNPVELFQPER